MPGLNQLKKFIGDVQKLGDEEVIRAQRGEKLNFPPIPEGISEEDDSDDFIVGIPEPEDASDSDTPDEISEPTEMEPVEDLFSDVGESSGSSDGIDIDSLISPDTDGGLDDLGLDEFMKDSPAPAAEAAVPDAEPVASDSSDLDDMFADLGSLGAAPADSGNDPNSDFAFSGEPIDMNEGLPENIAENDVLPKEEQSAVLQSTDNLADVLPSDAETVEIPSDIPSSGADEPLDTSFLDDMNLSDNLSAESEAPSSESASPVGDVDLSGLGSMEMPDFDDNTSVPVDTLPEDVASGEGTKESAASDNSPVSNDIDNIFDTSGLDFDKSSQTGAETPDATQEVLADVFDTSAMEGLDFAAEEKKEGQGGDDEFPETSVEGFSSGDDFVLADDFEIPGFSDTDTADLGKGRPAAGASTASGAVGPAPKNSLTDDEYRRFKENLAEYPLNLRVIIEEFIAKNEFTDETVFEVIDKIVKKASARQVATQLEKMLDIAINVPRDFERRSFAQYEAYKQSFQYQLKNRIIPLAIVGVVLFFVAIGLFKAGVHFIYKPVMANMNYKQGYALLENNEFPQSEEKFNEAVKYKPVKKWFFKYAEGYRERKQYERAALMYRNILGYFNFDKKAGLDYANMELYDRSNYAHAERIVRRHVLDHHINDPDGILLLGDIYLEWAEEDPSKYEDAMKQYSYLETKYPKEKVYPARMLRYYIRTDQLRKVLQYKTLFYPNKKSLSSQDWTELSGYLLDKLYGTLSKNDEYLRSFIEDVRGMLEIAIKSDLTNPVSRYNLARYFIYNGYMEQARSEMNNALTLFKNVKVRTKKNVYREINAARILGELYNETREYLKAQEVFTRGINLYNEENKKTGLEGDENTGKLFADIGDIDYFIAGDLDGALKHYETAIKIKNDTPTLNFRVGAIYYGKHEYDKALASFLKVAETKSTDENLLISLANVLSLRGDNFAALSYYNDLIRLLEVERARIGVLSPQTDEDDHKIVERYMHASNNLGVTLYRIAKQTGNSEYNAQAIVRFSDSMRAWDSLTRNQETMIKLGQGDENLAARNSKYVMHPIAEFEPAIYTEIPRYLENEKILQ